MQNSQIHPRHQLERVIDSFRSMAFSFFPLPIFPLYLFPLCFFFFPVCHFSPLHPPLIASSRPNYPPLLPSSTFFIGNKFCQLIASPTVPYPPPSALSIHFSLHFPGYPLDLVASTPPHAPLHPSLAVPPLPLPSCQPQCLLCHCLSIFLCLRWWDWPDTHTHRHTDTQAHTHTYLNRRQGWHLSGV